MRIRLFLILSFLSLVAVNPSTFSQGNNAEKIAILPISSVGVDESTVQSAQAILRLEIDAASNWSIVPESEVREAMGDQLCNDLDCAVDIGNRLGATKVLACNLTGLGEKVLVYYTLFDIPSGAAILKDNATSLFIEDLDAVLKRVAVSVSSNTPMQRTADVDNITAKESLDPLRRGSNTVSGFTFGYLFPQEGYDKDDRSFTLDFRIGQELSLFEVGLLLAARKGFAVNIFGHYLFTRKDVCPYLGGAFGFHWVVHEQHEVYNAQTGIFEDDNRRGDGLELTLNGGLKIFRTYNFQILLNFAYLITFNDYDDRATVFTIGLVK